MVKEPLEILDKEPKKILAKEPICISCFSCFHIKSNFAREAIAEMQNKEVAATTTLLNNGEQVLLYVFILVANIVNIGKDHLAQQCIWRAGSPVFL